MTKFPYGGPWNLSSMSSITLLLHDSVFPKKFYDDTWLQIHHGLSSVKVTSFPWIITVFHLLILIHTPWTCIAHLNKSMQLSIVYFDLQRSKLVKVWYQHPLHQNSWQKNQQQDWVMNSIMCNPISSHAIFTFRL